MVTIAIDVAGGDNAPSVPIKGAALLAQELEDVKFLLYGNEAIIREEVEKKPYLKAKSEIIHSNFIIQADDKPSHAVRKKGSSMWDAVYSIREGIADAAISAGNTGALMAISKVMLRTLPNISRPAICTTLPTEMGQSVMLDLGANVECNAENLYQFALMGASFAKAIFKCASPKIGLLNIGSEENKGNDSIKLASMLIKESPAMGPNFYGFIEGNDIARGIVDVIVTDGFSGNVAIKTAEGTASLFRNSLKEASTASLLARLGFLLARCSIKKVFKKFDPRFYNGAMLLGLNGIVVKSHGSADEVGFANALKVAYTLVNNNINQQIVTNYPQVLIKES